MVDIQQQMNYWKAGAQEDMAVAAELVGGGRHRHGLFFAHLSLEKILKAHICKSTQAVAPRIHNLVRLSEMADLKLAEEQIDCLAEMNEFNLEGRYPIHYIDTVSQKEAEAYLKKSKDILQWLAPQL